MKKELLQGCYSTWEHAQLLGLGPVCCTAKYTVLSFLRCEIAICQGRSFEKIKIFHVFQQLQATTHIIRLVHSFSLLDCIEVEIWFKFSNTLTMSAG